MGKNEARRRRKGPWPHTATGSGEGPSRSLWPIVSFAFALRREPSQVALKASFLPWVSGAGWGAPERPGCGKDVSGLSWAP